ncbi:hypothetical protein AB0H88_34515 [Nonomuraea sp. NPDC050680]|uniref:hypothetical protein n=1 Tax=Nonomuraea sp. NPDC050680 TaxID=3154630 RepID=UPI0033D5A47D
MSRLGPVITLTAGAALAVGLGVASITATPAANSTAAATSNEPSATETTAAAEPSAEPAATAATVTPEPTETAEAAPKTIDKADYGGYVRGKGGLIAISTRDGKTIGYFCDGKSEAWFKGNEKDGKITLRGFGAAAVGGTLGGGKATGWLKIGGKKWTFAANTVVKPSGLYRATAQVRGAKLRAGWIVLKRPQGGFTQVGAAFADEKQLQIPQLNAYQPTEPVPLDDDTTLYPKDVDGFIQEMQ